MRPDALLPALLRSDSARPRITCYDDTTGERIELSAKVLANWVAKAANLLQDEFDVGPGSVVALDLPPHWRTLYWALAVWRTGAAVHLPPAGGPAPDLRVTTADRATTADAGLPTVAVTLAALARRSPTPLPPGVLDEARDLATYADSFDPLDVAAGDDPALFAGGATAAYGTLVGTARGEGAAYGIPLGSAAGDPHRPTSGGPGPRLHTATTDTAGFLRLALVTYAADGSLVLSIAPDPARLAARLAAEGATDVTTAAATEATAG